MYICIHMCMYLINWNDLQATVQQRLADSGKSKRLVVAQSHKAGYF